MPVVIDGTTGVTAAAFDGAVDGADLTGDVAAARITGALNASGSAPIYACRAWVNFNGTGTVAIRASGNVSSITDNGVGDYTVNFTTAMPDANYAVTGAGQMDTSNANAGARVFGIRRASGALQAGSCRVVFSTTTDAGFDQIVATVAIFR
jgi:hypothetical protein